MIFLKNKDILKCFIKKNINIRKTIKILDQNRSQICLVIHKNKLIGTVTDGDIRRSLIHGSNLDDSILKTINYKPTVIDKKISFEKASAIMSEKNIMQLPLINKKKKVLGVYFLNNPKKKKLENPIVILCGGRGMRLMPYTKKIPKPMLKIDGKPILEHIIDNLKSQGFKNIFLSVFYLKEKIKKYFKNGKNFGVKINYIEEKKAMGTCGCLSILRKDINYKDKDKDIIVLNGDIISKTNLIDMLNFHKSKHSLGTMATLQYEIKNPYGVIKTNDLKIVGFEEKPINKTNINAGIYIISKKALKLIPNYKFDMSDFFKKLVKLNKKTFVYQIYEYWREIGTKSIYEKFSKKK